MIYRVMYLSSIKHKNLSLQIFGSINSNDLEYTNLGSLNLNTVSK